MMIKKPTKPYDTQEFQSLVEKAILREKEKENNAKVLSDIIAKTNEKSRKQRKIKQIILYPILSVASVFLIFIMIKHPFRSTPERFFEESFNPETRESIYRGEDSKISDTSVSDYSVENLFSQAKTAMSKQEWEQAEEILIPMLEKGGSIEIESLWHLALITSQTKQYDECKRYLDRLLESKDPTHKADARKLLRIIKKGTSKK